MAKIMLYLFLCCLFMRQCSSKKHLSATDFWKMPPLYQLDDYDRCLHKDEGLYCGLELKLVSDEPSPLLDMIHEYSSHTYTHYNHSKLRIGVCVTETCKDYYKENKTADLRTTLEGCLNESYWNNYRLKTKVLDNFGCYSNKEELKLDVADILMAIVVLTLFMLNIVGSFYDVWTNGDKRANGERNKYLLCFSLKRNWQRLVAPECGPDPRLNELAGLNGIKGMLIISVVMGHSVYFFIMVFYSETHTFEERVTSPMMQILLNGSILNQGFLITSAFLLVYNILVRAETRQFTRMMILKEIFQRWLRLTPTLAVVLGIISTWMRHSTRGPYWQFSVGEEVQDCRRYWWLHILQLNNFIGHNHCIVPSWFPAMDMQLSCLGISVAVLLKSSWSRRVVLSILLVLGAMLPPLYTYWLDLDVSFLFKPEAVRNRYEGYDTFNEMYKKLPANMFGYISGLCLAYQVFHWQNNKADRNMFKKYRIVVWFTVPSFFLMFVSLRYFYEPRSLLLRILASALIRPWAALAASAAVITAVFKVEDTYSGILRWPGWRIPSRLAYTASIINVPMIRYFVGINTMLLPYRSSIFMMIYVGQTSMIFMASVPFHLMVEAPLAQLSKLVFTPDKKKPKTA